MSNNGYVSGQSTSPYQSFSIDKSDTIRIYYEENIFYDISYEVFPKGSGQIRSQNIYLTDSTINYPYNESVSIEGIPKNGWRFSHWESQNNDINPNKNTSIANFTVENTDYIQCIL